MRSTTTTTRWRPDWTRAVACAASCTGSVSATGTHARWYECEYELQSAECVWWAVSSESVGVGAQ